LDNIQTTPTPAPLPAFMQKYLALRTSGQDHEQACESYEADLPLEPTPLEAVWDVAEEHSQFRARRDAFAHRLAMTARPVPTISSKEPIRTQAQAPTPKPRPYAPAYAPAPYRGAYQNRDGWAAYNSKTAERRIDARRFYKKKVRHAHNFYLSGRISLERYVDEIISFIDVHEDIQPIQASVHAFLAENAAALQDRTFCPKGSTPKFNYRILSAWNDYRAKTGCNSPSEAQQEQEEAIAADSAPIPNQPQRGKDKLASLKYYATRAGLTKAYQDYLSKGELAGDVLYELVYKFAVGKAEGRMFEQEEASKTFQDVASEITAYVWHGLNTPKGEKGAFSGNPDSFYPWLNRITYQQACKAFTENLEELNTKAPYFVTMEDGTIEDNPEMYREERPSGKSLPSWIEGIDLQICDYIRHKGYGYGRIADELGVSVAAVTLRISKMRRRIQAEKAAKYKK